MKLLKLQPTFTLDVPIPADQAITQIRRAINTAELRGHADAAGACVDFKIAPEERRFWSPHLSVQCSDTESGSQLVARFSPRPEIWTMVMAIYFVVMIAIFAAGIYGYVQWFMGDRPWALLVIPFGVMIILGLHVASLIGQSLSADQMTLLRQRFDRAIAIALRDEID